MAVKCLAVCCAVVGTYFGILLIVVLLGSDPPADQMISHRVRQGKVVIPSSRHISVLNQREVQVSVEVLLQLCDVLHPGEASHRDLFLSLVVRQGLRHSGWRSSSLEECKHTLHQGTGDTAGEAPTATGSASGLLRTQR